jgi:hypothetical protein
MCELDSSEKGPVAAFCEHGNKLLDIVNGGKFLDKHFSYHLLHAMSYLGSYHIIVIVLQCDSNCNFCYPCHIH